MSRKKQLEEREKHWFEGTSDSRSLQRSYEEEQRVASLNPVRSKWTNPPPADMMRPRSAQRLRDAQDRDGCLNRSDFSARPGSAPTTRSATPWREPRSSKPRNYETPVGYGAYDDSGEYGAFPEEEEEKGDDGRGHGLDADSALTRLTTLHYEAPPLRPKNGMTLLKAWKDDPGFEAGDAVLGATPTNLKALNDKRHAARGQASMALLNHQSAASTHADWVAEMTAILDLNHQEQAHLDEEIEELLHGKSKFKEMKAVLIVMAQKFLKIALHTWMEHTIHLEHRREKQTQKDLATRVREAKAAYEASAAALEGDRAKAVALALQRSNHATYQLLLKMFSKFHDNAERFALNTWVAKVQHAKAEKLKWTRFFSKITNFQLHSGFHAWVRNYRWALLPPEGQMAVLREKIAAHKRDIEEHRAATKADLERAMATHAGSEEESGRRLLCRVIARLLHKFVYYGWKRWRSRCDLFKKQVKIAGKLLTKFERRFESVAFATWSSIVKRELELANERSERQLKSLIHAMRRKLKGQVALLTSLVADVEAMRDSIALQAAAARRVAAGLPGVAAALGDCVGHGARPIVIPMELPDGSIEETSENVLPPATRANLLVFLRRAHETDRLEPGFLEDLSDRVPNFERHLRSMKKLALAGDPRFAAAVQAFQMIGDTRDLWETIEIIDEMEEGAK